MRNHARELPLIVALAIALAGIATAQGPAQEGGAMTPPQQQWIEQRLEVMQEHMLRMHELMHRIEDAEGEEREALLAEQRNLMREHMRTMRGRMGPGMSMGPGI
jgi:hypothetical protein